MTAVGKELMTIPPQTRWNENVSPYEWLVLIVASAGWVFDAFEGQIFNITRADLLADLLRVGSHDPLVQRWGDILLGIFLAGGTMGGMLFGSLGDRLGRRPTMNLTILFYSVFSGLTWFATSLWQVAALRFLVAMGVGGEWAVAAALVAEVFPRHARAHASGIFHATSVLGIWVAALVGLFVGSHWRWAYLIGVLPALLTLWVRLSIREPESWRKAAASEQRLGSFRDLLGNPHWRRHALLGMLLATIGLGTFWGITVAGQDLARDMLMRDQSKAAASGTAPPPTGRVATFLRNEKVAYGLVQTAGGGLGMLLFGPICYRLGRRRAFFGAFLGSLLVVPATCYLPGSYWQLLMFLPFFAFFTHGLHAGFAVYFPELFPNHLRATGAGFCFNGGRLLAASVLIFSGWLKSLPGMDLRLSLTLLSLLFAAGIVVVICLPETRGQPLPD